MKLKPDVRSVNSCARDCHQQRLKLKIAVTKTKNDQVVCKLGAVLRRNKLKFRAARINA